MLRTILTFLQVVSAVGIVGLVLLQRGKGADAGAGFGAGASGTVFGARGSANFLSSATKWLAVVFFGLSLFMAWQASHNAKAPGDTNPSIMSDLPPAADKPSTTLAPAPLAPAPVAPAPAAGTPVIAPALPAVPPPGAGTTTSPEPVAPAASTPAGTSPAAPASPPPPAG